MFDWNAAAQVAISPVVTLPVITALVVLVLGQEWHARRRLRAYHKASGEILQFVGKIGSMTMRRQQRRIEELKAQIKTGTKPERDIFKTLFEGTPFKSDAPDILEILVGPFGRPLGGRSFSMDELREALKRKNTAPGSGSTDDNAGGFDPATHDPFAALAGELRGYADGGTVLRKKRVDDIDGGTKVSAEDIYEGVGPRPYHDPRAG